MTEEVKGFFKTGAERVKSETPSFWKNMRPVMGGFFGGLSAVQASLPEGAPQWVKWGIVFLVGAAGYFVGNFGSKNHQ